MTENINNDIPDIKSELQSEENNNFKYKNHAEAEKGYQELQSLLGRKNDEMTQEIQKVKDEHIAPAEYSVPDGIAIDEIARNELNRLAKEANLNQSQYQIVLNKLMQQKNSSNEIQKSLDEQSKKELHSIPNFDEKSKILDTYIDNTYSKHICENIKKNLGDKTFFSNLWEEREKSVSAITVPNNIAPIVQTIKDDDITKLRKKMENNPHMLNLRDQYIEIMRLKAAESNG